MCGGKGKRARGKKKRATKKSSKRTTNKGSRISVSSPGSTASSPVSPSPSQVKVPIKSTSPPPPPPSPSPPRTRSRSIKSSLSPSKSARPRVASRSTKPTAPVAPTLTVKSNADKSEQENSDLWTCTSVITPENMERMSKSIISTPSNAASSSTKPSSPKPNVVSLKTFKVSVPKVGQRQQPPVMEVADNKAKEHQENVTKLATKIDPTVVGKSPPNKTPKRRSSVLKKNINIADNNNTSPGPTTSKDNKDKAKQLVNQNKTNNKQTTTGKAVPKGSLTAQINKILLQSKANREALKRKSRLSSSPSGGTEGRKSSDEVAKSEKILKGGVPDGGAPEGGNKPAQTPTTTSTTQSVGKPASTGAIQAQQSAIRDSLSSLFSPQPQAPTPPFAVETKRTIIDPTVEASDKSVSPPTTDNVTTNGPQVAPMSDATPNHSLEHQSEPKSFPMISNATSPEHGQPPLPSPQKDTQKDERDDNEKSDSNSGKDNNKDDRVE